MPGPTERDIRFEQVAPDGVEATAAMESYFAELDARFPGGFSVTGALGPGSLSMSPPGGTFVLARDADGEVAGCGGLQRHDHNTGEIKRMWISPRSRGLGIGRRLLAELECCAAGLGYTSVVLDTNGTLVEAIAMYESAGYVEIDRYNDNPHAEHWFVKQLDVGNR